MYFVKGWSSWFLSQCYVITNSLVSGQEELDWKFIATVVDRLFLYLFTAACLCGTLTIFLYAPSLYDHREALPLQDASEDCDYWRHSSNLVMDHWEVHFRTLSLLLSWIITFTEFFSWNWYCFHLRQWLYVCCKLDWPGVLASRVRVIIITYGMLARSKVTLKITKWSKTWHFET
jgi:hypothetical protein